MIDGKSGSSKMAKYGKMAPIIYSKLDEIFDLNNWEQALKMARFHLISIFIKTPTNLTSGKSGNNIINLEDQNILKILNIKHRF